MASSANRGRPAWSDRFRQPTAKELVEGVAEPAVGAVRALREALLAGRGDDGAEVVTWRGVWKWTLAYRGSDRPFAYVIADPAKPRLSIPVSDAALAELALRKLSRVVRDGLSHAPNVDGVRWATWDVQSEQQAEELIVLVRLLAEPAPAKAAR